MATKKSKTEIRKEQLTKLISALIDERDELVADVNGNPAFIGGPRLDRYQEMNSIINFLGDKRDKVVIEEDTEE